MLSVHIAHCGGLAVLHEMHLRAQWVSRVGQKVPTTLTSSPTQLLARPHKCEPRRCRLTSAHAFNNMFQGWLGGGGKKDERQEPVQSAVPEEEDFATMRRLDEDDSTGVDGSDEAFGPPAVLLIGFSAQELEGFRSLMLSMEADMFKISPCTKTMLDGSLEKALAADCPVWEQPPLGTRRVIVLSGMFSGEVVEVVSAYRDSDLPPAVFCCAVPNNMDKRVKDLVTEVTAEDAIMRKMAAERAAAASCSLDDQSDAT